MTSAEAAALELLGREDGDLAHGPRARAPRLLALHLGVDRAHQRRRRAGRCGRRGCSWSPIRQRDPSASIRKHSYSSAARFLNEWKSPHVVWNLPVCPSVSRPSVRA